MIDNRRLISLYSTVTDLARLRLVDIVAFLVASSQANICSGTVATKGCSNVDTFGNLIMTSAYGLTSSSSFLGTMVLAPRARISCRFEITVVQQVPAARGNHDEDRQLILDQCDRTMLQLTGREAFGVDVGQLLQLQGAFECDRISNVPADEEDRTACRRTRPRAPSPAGSCEHLGDGIRHGGEFPHGFGDFLAVLVLSHLCQIEPEQVPGNQLGQETFVDATPISGPAWV